MEELNEKLSKDIDAMEGKRVKINLSSFIIFRIDFGAKPETPEFADVHGTRYI